MPLLRCGTPAPPPVLPLLFADEEALPIPSDILMPLTIDWVTEPLLDELLDDEAAAVAEEADDEDEDDDDEDNEAVADGGDDEDDDDVDCKPLLAFAFPAAELPPPPPLLLAAELPTFFVAFSMFLIAVAALTGDYM